MKTIIPAFSRTAMLETVAIITVESGGFVVLVKGNGVVTTRRRPGPGRQEVEELK